MHNTIDKNFEVLQKKIEQCNTIHEIAKLKNKKEETTSKRVVLMKT